MEIFAPQSVDDLLPGDVGFTTIPGLVGGPVAIGQALLDMADIIRPRPDRWAENMSIWTHAYWVLPDGWLIEAMPRGARIVPIKDRWGPRFAYGRVALTDEQRGNVDKLAREGLRGADGAWVDKLEGRRYGFSDYAALATWELGIPGRHMIRGYVQNNRRLICSQLVDYGWCALGYHHFTDGRLPQDVTPGALFWQTWRKGQTFGPAYC